MAPPRRVRRPDSAGSPVGSAPAATLATPPRKPMARPRRVSLFEREVKIRLAPVALDLIHDAARVLTEGDLVGQHYAGSTMLTVDLLRTTDRVSDPADATTARRLAELYLADPTARARARRVAMAEARRTAGVELAGAQVDVETSHRGPELHLSLNVEAQRRNA